MTQETFNLSKWVISEKGEPKLYLERDIKKFIKQLRGLIDDDEIISHEMLNELTGKNFVQ